ncbi:MAG TPA: sulfite exporter TauE/SafE family protein [Candidatus Sulfotelmatobacter sp.]|jgi:sulfite exporter TauE/SafE|nr:sulfite exporter TauE/SafE family protein [Candidatus Sulfotelmatobacter sp.]
MDEQSALLALMHSGIAQCQVVISGNGSLLASLFLAGLVGGVSHCAGMCGPFVLSQVAARLESTSIRQMSEWHRLAGAAALPYHLGRASTYALLGAVGALIAGSLNDLSGLHWLSAGLLVFAALFMLAMAVPALKRLISGSSGQESWWSRKIGGVARPLFATPTGWKGYLLGILLGFIPCGLLYGAVAAASATGNLLAGLFGMLTFAIGTAPTLVAVGLVGHMAGQHWREGLLRWAPLLLVLNAGVLTMLAWRHVA